MPSPARSTAAWRPTPAPCNRSKPPLDQHRSILAIGLGVRACQAGYRVLFATASEWVDRLAEAHHSGRLQTELTRLTRYPLLVIDEVGYLPLDRAEANMVFQLVSRRYERGTMIITSNKSFAEWGGVLGDDVLATAILDRLVHHADVLGTSGMQSCS